MPIIMSRLHPLLGQASSQVGNSFQKPFNLFPISCFREEEIGNG